MAWKDAMRKQSRPAIAIATVAVAVACAVVLALSLRGKPIADPAPGKARKAAIAKSAEFSDRPPARIGWKLAPTANHLAEIDMPNEFYRLYPATEIVGGALVCERNFMRMMPLRDNSQAAFAVNLMTQANVEKAGFDVFDFLTEGTWKDSYGYTGLNNWSSFTHDDEDCAVVFRSDWSWHDDKCSAQVPILCKGEKILAESTQDHVRLALVAPGKFNEGKAVCGAHRMRFHAPRNAAENTRAVQLMTQAGHTATHINYSDKDVEGTWRTVDGETLSYTNWDSGQPNNYNNQDFGMINQYGKWHDTTDGARPFLCVMEQIVVETIVERHRYALVASGAGQQSIERCMAHGMARFEIDGAEAAEIAQTLHDMSNAAGYSVFESFIAALKSDSGAWFDDNAEELSYQPWGNTATDRTCATFKAGQIYRVASSQSRPVLCQGKSSTLPISPRRLASKCLPGGRCFRLFSSQLTCSDAAAVCAEFGMQLFPSSPNEVEVGAARFLLGQATRASAYASAGAGVCGTIDGEGVFHANADERRPVLCMDPGLRAVTNEGRKDLMYALAGPAATATAASQACADQGLKLMSITSSTKVKSGTTLMGAAGESMAWCARSSGATAVLQSDGTFLSATASQALYALCEQQTPAFELTSNERKYSVFANVPNINVGRKLCATLGRSLATSQSAAENSAIAQAIAGAQASRAAIGLNDRGISGSFQYDNGDDVLFTNWAGSPGASSLRCGFVEASGAWTRGDCHAPMHVVCEGPGSVIETAHKGKKLAIFSGGPIATLHRLCAAQGMTRAKLDADTSSVVAQLLADTRHSQANFDAHDKNHDGVWVTESGQAYSAYNWEAGHPINDGNHDCILVMNTGLWQSVSCNAHRAVVCEKQMWLAETTWSDHTFRLFDYQPNWDAAKATCESHDMVMASIHNDATQTAVLGAINAANMAAAWLGLTQRGHTNQYVFTTGEALRSDFSGWAAGEPNNRHHRQQCVEVRASGEWFDSACSKRLPVVCKSRSIVAEGSFESKKIAMLYHEWDVNNKDAACASAGMRALRIESAEENEAVRAWMVGKTDKAMFAAHRLDVDLGRPCHATRSDVVSGPAILTREVIGHHPIDRDRKCCALCRLTPGCDYWAHQATPTTGASECVLKKVSGTPQFATNVWSSTANQGAWGSSTIPSWRGAFRVDSADFGGCPDCRGQSVYDDHTVTDTLRRLPMYNEIHASNHYRSEPAALNAGDCGYFCATDDNCRAWRYHPIWGEKCKMYKVFEGDYENLSSTTKSGKRVHEHLYHGYGDSDPLPFNDYLAVGLPSHGTHWIWHGDKTKKCVMIHAADGWWEEEDCNVNVPLLCERPHDPLLFANQGTVSTPLVMDTTQKTAHPRMSPGAVKARTLAKTGCTSSSSSCANSCPLLEATAEVLYGAINAFCSVLEEVPLVFDSGILECSDIVGVNDQGQVQLVSGGVDIPFVGSIPEVSFGADVLGGDVTSVDGCSELGLRPDAHYGYFAFDGDLCVAANPCCHTYGLGTSLISVSFTLPPAQVTVSPNALAFSLTGELQYTSTTDVWDLVSLKPLTATGHFAFSTNVDVSIPMPQQNPNNKVVLGFTAENVRFLVNAGPTCAHPDALHSGFMLSGGVVPTLSVETPGFEFDLDLSPMFSAAGTLALFVNDDNPTIYASAQRSMSLIAPIQVLASIHPLLSELLEANVPTPEVLVSFQAYVDSATSTWGLRLSASQSFPLGKLPLDALPFLANAVNSIPSASTTSVRVKGSSVYVCFELDKAIKCFDLNSGVFGLIGDLVEFGEDAAEAVVDAAGEVADAFEDLGHEAERIYEAAGEVVSVYTDAVGNVVNLVTDAKGAVKEVLENEQVVAVAEGVVKSVTKVGSVTAFTTIDAFGDAKTQVYSEGSKLVSTGLDLGNNVQDSLFLVHDGAVEAGVKLVDGTGVVVNAVGNTASKAYNEVKFW